MHVYPAEETLALDALTRQCEALEAHLRQTRTVSACLLDFALNHLLAA